MPDRPESTEPPPAPESTARRSRRARQRRAQGSSLREATVGEEQPRERLLLYGAHVLSDAELLGVLVCSHRGGPSMVEVARELLHEAGGIAGLVGAHPAALRHRGIGPVKLAVLAAAIELACRLAKTQVPDREPLSRPEEAARYLAMRYALRDQEVVGALFLDARNRLMGERELYRGTLTRAAVETREVLKEGLLRGAAGLVLFHSHPSGDPSPSSEDLLFTRQLAAAGEVVGVRLVDHLILGTGGRWVSLYQRGAC